LVWRGGGETGLFTSDRVPAALNLTCPKPEIDLKEEEEEERDLINDLKRYGRLTLQNQTLPILQSSLYI